MATKSLKITGQVQGVGFRYQMCDFAISHHVTGWVKNCPDGSVEAMVSGSDALVDEVIRWAQKGPPAARVDNVEVSEGSGQFDDFEILPA